MSVPRMVVSSHVGEHSVPPFRGLSPYPSPSPLRSLSSRSRRHTSSFSNYRERSTSLSSDSRSGNGYVMSCDSPSLLAKKVASPAVVALSKTRCRNAQKMNDMMVYLDGPQVYTCNQCRTHLTSHDDIISKSFHGRHGRAYLFDNCVNIVIGPAEDRMLITGLHSVCDTFCKRCKSMVGWTYSRAYEPSQKYKEGKFIIEKINLHLEEATYYDVRHPAGERSDRWRLRSMSWGSDGASPTRGGDIVYEYSPSDASSSSLEVPSCHTADISTTTYVPVRKNARLFTEMTRSAPSAPTL